MDLPPMPPLTCVLMVLRQNTHVAALVHVMTLTSSFLDHGLPQLWTLPRACEANLLSLLPRLIARELSSDVDPHYWRYQCRLGLVSAVKNDNLAMVEWIHDICPSVQPFLPMLEAAKTGNVLILAWLSALRMVVIESPLMNAAASNDHVNVLQWLQDQPKNGGKCTREAFRSAVRGGHIGAVKWLYVHYPRLADPCESDILTAMRSGHREVIKFLFGRPERFAIPCSIVIPLAAELGDLEMVQWLCSRKSSASSFFVSTPIDCAASKGHLHMVQWIHAQHLKRYTGMMIDQLNYWSRENHLLSCTTSAMDNAAGNGHLGVVSGFTSIDRRGARRLQSTSPRDKASSILSSGSTKIEPKVAQ